MDLNKVIDRNFRGNIYIVQGENVIFEKENGLRIWQMKFPIRLTPDLQAHLQAKCLSQSEFCS